MTGTHAPLAERLWRRLEVVGECWLWGGALNEHGYGRIWVQELRTHRGVHVVSYEIHEGPVPEGLTIDHVAARGCRHRHCARPDHLEAVTIQENLARAVLGENNRSKTECPAGHPYDEANTIWRKTKGGGLERKCRICRRAQVNAYNARRRAA